MHPVLAMAIGIVVMMGLIIFTKMHAFPSLIISAILIGILALPSMGEGATLASVISSVTTGFGGTMASIGVVIGFGCIMYLPGEVRCCKAHGSDHSEARWCQELRRGSGPDRFRGLHPRFL